jgi:cobalt-zinc-cadmium efflux system protein
MSDTHNHGAGSNQKALALALGITTVFLVVEIAGGILTGSLALLSDAAHMFTDAAALAISLLAMRLARKPADDTRTFGYHRLEILAAAFNAILLFGVALYILYEAWRRLTAPAEVQSVGMLAIAVVGLVTNLASMRLLSAGKSESLNVKGAYLEVWADMLGSIGVIAGAVVIHFTGWTWVDSLVAVGIGLWVLPRTWTLLSESFNVLLEGVPHGIELKEVQAALAGHAGVGGLHDLHVWSLSSGSVSLSVHIVQQPGIDGQVLLRDLRSLLAGRFDIHHSTLQIETIPCDQAAGEHGFGPSGHEEGHPHGMHGPGDAHLPA